MRDLTIASSSDLTVNGFIPLSTAIVVPAVVTMSLGGQLQSGCGFDKPYLSMNGRGYWIYTGMDPKPETASATLTMVIWLAGPWQF